jgi:hypothetical protein
MTVNYTANLALGQPVTGTESGTWGDDVNNAITAYLDIAIAGALSLTAESFTANAITLTNSQGTYVSTNIGPTTAQYYILRVRDLTNNAIITAPSVNKTYLVINADFNYAVTIKAAGQTGVSIVAGEKALVGFNGTDYIRIANTNGPGTFSTLALSSYGTIKALFEASTITTSAPAATTNYDVLTQVVQYYTTNAANNFTLNIRGNSTTSLNSVLAIGQSVTMVLLVTNGATAYYANVIQIDGVTITPKWQFGLAPTGGSASSIDSYTFAIVKTANATYTVLGSVMKYA